MRALLILRTDTAYWLSWEETENSASVASPFGQIESAHAINDGVDDFPAGQEFKDATCASRNVAAAVIGSMKPISTRIPYNNGYGDFFFGRQRLVEKRKYKITDDMSEEEKLEMAGITSSNGVPVVELNGFERCAPRSWSRRIRRLTTCGGQDPFHTKSYHPRSVIGSSGCSSVQSS